ncbi:hypothetical protein [Rufibacter ruber]|uniref:hypothetical protein n=1 Tax=Rufibacter ruber TaxID=1783499 RepID=UPI000834BF08|nr:hypothetical protein [Rufibacter ruber]
MKELKDIDKSYCNSIRQISTALQESFIEMQDAYSFDLEKHEVTEAVLERMKAYYQTQSVIKHFLGKRYATAGADFFVETTLFFIKLFLQKQGGHLQAYSEKQIMARRGAIRPDISIWENNEVVAIIECKTQLGWNRHGWENDLINREVKLKNEFPNANCFLLVMTGLNWGGFGEHDKLGIKYFCLLNDIWPNNYENMSQILTPIEKLLKAIIEK